MTNPIPVPQDFKPGARVYELCEERDIPQPFVDGLVSSFIFYWTEKKDGRGAAIKRASWQHTFWNHVKMKWQWKQDKAGKGVRTSSAGYKDHVSEPINVAERGAGKAEMARMRELGII